ncbi:MAG: amidohydrolase [Betaproteobacteria bacterium]|jgi:N-acyl-D-aspartate/D-glutamate deacylase|nr:MAG: amidohydrolase [Betaproteobacteria bacterium]TMH80533.1 MAG: amidohydrolase [Betaproteobacteria bacterium]
MALDILIENGIVVDGTGAPAKQASIGIAQGKIAEVGNISGTAKRTIDAGGLVVAPGFIDPHTHYDAQICWDGATTPSSWHGVTSVVMGNCGVGIAPCRPEAREIAMRDLVNVEAIPFEVLDAGITWDWETFPQYMDAAARRKPSLNLAFLAPLTPFRHYVMNEDSLERSATAEETAKIKALLGEAIDAGAFGFSSTLLNQHMGYGGRPLACRNASREEIKAYCNALRERGKGSIEYAMTRQIAVMEEPEVELLGFMLEESRRPVTFIAMFDRDDLPEAARETLRKVRPLIAKGARPQTSPLPLTREVNMRNPFGFAGFPSWKRLFVDKSKEAQAAVYRDVNFRNQFREDLKRPASFGNWARITLHEVKSAHLKKYEGKTVAEIAAEQGKDGVDALLDITLEDDLENEFTIQSYNNRVDRMAEILNDRSVLLGLGDGGAHLDMLCDSGYPTYVLGMWVRERKVLTLEEAVRRMTSDPADFFGIKDRGRLKPGLAADVVIFSEKEIGSGGRPERLYDLPGGAKRMVMRSRGVEMTLVNGAVTWEKGALTGAAAGKVLRS